MRDPCQSETGVSIGFSPEVLLELFPFHLAFDADLTIVQVGRVLARISPTPLLGRPLQDCFELGRPKLKHVDFAGLKRRSQSVFLLEAIGNPIRLRGQMVYLEDSQTLFFLCNLWITAKSKIAELGIKLKDFPSHDPIADFLFAIQAKDRALSEVETLLEELHHQQNKLQATLEEKSELAAIADRQAQQLQATLDELQRTQTQLVHTAKMSALGQLVGGIAHEINNPVTFITGNLQHVGDYSRTLADIAQRYRDLHPDAPAEIADIVAPEELDFIIEDLPSLQASMASGTQRITEIVASLGLFVQNGRQGAKRVDLRDGLDRTLRVLKSRLDRADRPIQIERRYGSVPNVECYPDQLNQVFMNLLVNAIEAIETRTQQQRKHQADPDPGHIAIAIDPDDQYVRITISDNGGGVCSPNLGQLFEPFFTTKPVGQGTGLGLSMSYQIVVDNHGGMLSCESEPDRGATFSIRLPVRLARSGH